MEINNPALLDHIVEANGEVVRCKRIAIGVWDMDATTTVQIAHGLTWTNIIGITGFIYRDAMDYGYFIPSVGGALGAPDPTVWAPSITPANVVIQRQTGGVFDSVNFDDAVMNRGFIIVWYID